LIVLALVATASLVTFRAWRVDPDRPSVRLLPVSAIPSEHDAAPPPSCDERAQRFAEGPVWRRGPAFEESDRPLRWTAHYSPKYEACYVLVDRRGERASAAVVSELWDAIELEVLAEYTDDADAAVRRSDCQVTISEDPFTSCAVARYFVDEHMRH
jgi:hypothetical protein